MKRKLLIAVAVFALMQIEGSPVFSQKKPKEDKNKDKVTIENIEPICSDLAQEKKPRAVVANFKLTAPNAPRDQFGENLATMLTNALQQVKCFRVLERRQNMGDIEDELNYEKQSATNKKTMVQQNMMAANVIVQGEVTEFEQSESTMGVTAFKGSSYKSRVGIIIRLIDPQTREVIDSKSFNTEKKAGGGFRAGVTVPLIGNLDLASSAFKNPAVQDATEDCIIQAVQYIASEREKINLPENAVPDNSAQYTLTIKNIQYDQLTKVTSAIEKIQGVSSVSNDDFSDNTATISVVQSIKLGDMVNKLIAASSDVKLSVTGMNKEGATLMVK